MKISRWRLLAFIASAYGVGGQLSAFGDCGDEIWITPPKDVANVVRMKATGVMFVHLSSGAAVEFHTFALPKTEPTAGRLLSLKDLSAVSQAPSCVNPKHPLTGARFPVLASSGTFANIVLDAKLGNSAWINVNEFAGQVTQFDTIEVGSYLNLDFLPPDVKVLAYPAPKEGNSSKALTGGSFKIYERKGDFVLFKQSRWNDATEAWELEPIGWIRVRSKEGALLAWPWYQDDC